jgi:hypothetical protein
MAQTVESGAELRVVETSIPARMDRLPYWGPRRFAGALKAAVDQGRIRHTGVGR